MKRLSIVLIAALLAMMPVVAPAAQFAVLGPRALGMGGASVAAVNDSTAVYWNPAALAEKKNFDIRLPAGAAARDYMNLSDNWDRIDAIYDAIDSGDLSAADELKQLLLEFDRPDAVTNIDVSGGLFVSVPVANSAIAASVLGIGFAELYPTIDTLNMGTTGTNPSIQSNNSTVTGAGLVMAEPTVSFATSLGQSVLIGANAKMIYASTFLYTDSIRTGNYDTFIDNVNNTETRSHKGSLDAGILYKPLSNLSIGVVGRYLNSPSFPIAGVAAYKQPNGDVGIVSVSDEIEIKPQYRAGVAWKPLGILTLSADYDLSKNKSFTETTEDQTVAGGAELTVLNEVLSLRAGMYKNTANSLANIVYTAGLGLRIAAFRLDVAGAYDFDEQEAQASLSLALTF